MFVREKWRVRDGNHLQSPGIVVRPVLVEGEVGELGDRGRHVVSCYCVVFV